MQRNKSIDQSIMDVRNSLTAPPKEKRVRNFFIIIEM
jgi:hypothetical protein